MKFYWPDTTASHSLQHAAFLEYAWGVWELNISQHEWQEPRSLLSPQAAFFNPFWTSFGGCCLFAQRCPRTRHCKQFDGSEIAWQRLICCFDYKLLFIPKSDFLCLTIIAFMMEMHQEKKLSHPQRVKPHLCWNQGLFDPMQPVQIKCREKSSGTG